MKPTDDKEAQDAAERIAGTFEDEPGVTVGGGALSQAQANSQVESDLQKAELYAFPLLFLLSLLFFRSLVAALLPLLVGGLAIVSTMVTLRAASEVTDISIFALNLVTGLGLGLAIDYSLFIVSRYREEIAKRGPGHRRDAPHDGDGGPDRAVQRADGGGGDRLADRLPAALFVLDGHRRLDRGADRRRDRADRAARGARAARRAGQRARPRVPQPARRARRAARPRGVLVPALAAGDALPRPDRRGERHAADRPRDPVLQHPVHVGRRPGAPRVGERAPGGRRAARRLPAVPRHADHPRGPGWPRAGARGRASGRRDRRRRRGAPADRARPRRRGRAGDLREPAAQRREPGTGARTCARATRRASSPASARTSSTSRRASSTTCRWCSRSPASSPSSSCS